MYQVLIIKNAIYARRERAGLTRTATHSSLPKGLGDLSLRRSAEAPAEINRHGFDYSWPPPVKSQIIFLDLKLLRNHDKYRFQRHGPGSSALAGSSLRAAAS